MMLINMYVVEVSCTTKRHDDFGVEIGDCDFTVGKNERGSDRTVLLFTTVGAAKKYVNEHYSEPDDENTTVTGPFGWYVDLDGREYGSIEMETDEGGGCCLKIEYRFFIVKAEFA